MYTIILIYDDLNKISLRKELIILVNVSKLFLEAIS